MRELMLEEIETVGGAKMIIGPEAAYGAAVSVAGGFFALGLTVTAPVWGTAALLGASIAASGLAISYALGG